MEQILFVRQKIFSILLLIAFVSAILQPLIPFVQYYSEVQQESVVPINKCDCACQANETAQMANNGDAYLKALIKRVCKDQKKEQEKIPAITLSVFVIHLNRHYHKVFKCPEQNFHKISDFIIQPHPSSHIEELFRPPQSLS